MIRIKLEINKETIEILSSSSAEKCYGIYINGEYTETVKSRVLVFKKLVEHVIKNRTLLNAPDSLD